MLLASLTGHPRRLCDNPAALANPYAGLQIILLQSYGFSAAQKTALCWTTQAWGPTRPTSLHHFILQMRDKIDDTAARRVHFALTQGNGPGKRVPLFSRRGGFAIPADVSSPAAARPQIE
jgi:hypothetical protein